jgi:hypothetical protein
MSKHALGTFDVSNGQCIELLIAVATSDVDRKQDGPGDADTDEEDVTEDFQVPQEEEAVYGAMVEDKSVWGLEEWLDPVEPA